MKARVKNAWPHFSFWQAAWVTAVALLVCVLAYTVYEQPDVRVLPVIIYEHTLTAAWFFAFHYPLVLLARFVCLLINRPRAIGLYALLALLSNPLLVVVLWSLAAQPWRADILVLILALPSLIGAGLFYWLDNRQQASAEISSTADHADG